MGHDVATGELSGYFEAGEPGRRARADAWSTAIGLQQVDGLSTSPYLVQTAKDHIEGRISQVHPFYEGNTRTTAVFAVKYLGFLGFRVTNNMFREKSWYFRNALVRANYADYARGAKRDWSFLEAFFRNLLLGETNELRSRFLLIGLSERERGALRGAGGGQKKRSEKAVRKPSSAFGSC